jgi:hypothetical protein
MPRFDGTGPQGQGPMTGRGEGYCAVEIPAPGQTPYGYAGLQAIPGRSEALAARPTFGARFARWLRPATWPRRVFGGGRGRGRGAGRGRGRRFGQW